VHSFQIDQGGHPDFIVVRPPDQKSLGIEQIRDIIEQASFLPMMADRRFVVIDGADEMTVEAGNAFLKSLEEPHETTQYFLMAQSAHMVLPTVRSRCGIVRYRPLSESFVVSRLMQHTSDGAKALVYARLAEGSVGRALQYLGAGRLVLRDSIVSLLRKALTRDLASIFASVNAIAGAAVKGASGLKLGLHFLEHVLHDLAMIPYDPSRLTNIDLVEDITQLRVQIGDRRLESLLAGLKEIRRRQDSPINLGFHVKTYLATAFSE
jgi:DNA polymerase-3 subunit delta'